MCHLSSVLFNFIYLLSSIISLVYNLKYQDNLNNLNNNENENDTTTTTNNNNHVFTNYL